MEAAMRDVPNELSSGTLQLGLFGRGILAVLVAGAAMVGGAFTAQAGDGNGKKFRGYYAPGYVMVPPGHVYAAAPVVYAPAPVVYANPVVVAPAPVMYAPAYPVYASPYPPVGSLNLGISLPLR
jgi:hypothetical protein